MRGSLRGRLLLSCAAAAALGVTFVVSVPAASPTGPSRAADDNPIPAGSPAPSREPNPCKNVIGKRAVKQNFPKADSFVCGSPQADRITASGGRQHIWAWGGDDYINAANGYPDDIYAGLGLNTGRMDVCDRPYNPMKATIIRAGLKTDCPNLKPSLGLMGFISPADYHVWLPTVRCGGNNKDGERSMRFAEEPIMRAVNASPLVDWQTVAWSPLLYKWDGQKWAFSGQNIWVWDRTYDEQVRAFPGNFWRRFDNNQRVFLFFNPSTAGMYRVAVRFKFYAAPGVPAKEFIFWSGEHLGPFEDYPGQKWCNYPAPAPPAVTQPGHYAGTTAQGRGVQVDVGTNGLTFSNLKFDSVDSDLNCSEAGQGVFANGFRWGNTNHPFSGTVAPDGSFTYSETYNITLAQPAGLPAQIAATVNGRFASNGTVQGAISYTATFTYQGVQSNCRANNVGWSARK